MNSRHLGSSRRPCLLFHGKPTALRPKSDIRDGLLYVMGGSLLDDVLETCPVNRGQDRQHDDDALDDLLRETGDAKDV